MQPLDPGTSLALGPAGLVAIGMLGGYLLRSLLGLLCVKAHLLRIERHLGIDTRPAPRQPGDRNPTAAP